MIRTSSEWTTPLDLPATLGVQSNWLSHTSFLHSPVSIACLASSARSFNLVLTRASSPLYTLSASPKYSSQASLTGKKLDPITNTPANDTALGHARKKAGRTFAKTACVTLTSVAQ